MNPLDSTPPSAPRGCLAASPKRGGTLARAGARLWAALRGTIAVVPLALLGLAGCSTTLPSAEDTAPMAVAAYAPAAHVADGQPPTGRPREAAGKALQTALPPGGTDAAVIVPDPEASAAANKQAREMPSPIELKDADLWDRIRRGFAMPDLDNDLVRNREQWYASRPDYVQRMTQRASRYLFYIVEEVERRGLPTELALLPFIESAFNPQAVSVAKASGMWQFIPSTGKHFELTQNIFRDERRDVMASTRAALDYLTKLYGMFGDWHLALAAYNWGEGSVQRAIARNQKSGLPTDYENLRMPVETRYYVPKLQAIKNIVSRPESYGLALQSIENHPYFLTVEIQRDIDVQLAARLAGVPMEEFRALNPQMNKPVILAAGTPQILLPYDNARLFIRNLADHRGPLASWTAWVVPRTMRPGEAAKVAGLDEDELREVNKIPKGMLIKVGSTLLVPRDGVRHAKDVSSEIADNAIIALAPDVPPGRRTVVKAGKRDTLASLAKRYGVSVAQVAQWNRLTPSASLARGQRVVLYLPAKSASRATAKSTVSNDTRRIAATKETRRAAGKSTTRTAGAGKKASTVREAKADKRGDSKNASRTAQAKGRVVAKN